jgi:hypothetical protein
MRPSDLDREELELALQDVLTLAASGRKAGIRCTVCDKADVVVADADDGWVKVACPGCGLQFDGLLANPDEPYLPAAKTASKRTPFG